MADTTEADATGGKAEAAAARQPGRLARFLARRKLVAAVALVLALAGLGGGLVAALGISGAVHLVAGGPEAGAESAPGPEGHAKAEKDALFDIAPMQVNITGSNAEGAPIQRFLRIHISVVYPDGKKNAEKMAAKKAFLRDAFIGYLRGLHDSDLRGSLGLVTLKAELLGRARATVGSDLPRAILIEDMIIQ